jgi:hypothetical protein
MRSLQKLKKITFSGLFEQKFTTSSYRVGIERAWCSRKAWEKSGSLVPRKKELKKNPLPRSCPNRCQGKKNLKKILSLEAAQTGAKEKRIKKKSSP